MSTQIIIVLCSLGTLFLAVVGHLLATVWWASRINTSLSFFCLKLDGAMADWKDGKASLYKHIDDELEKRDVKINLLFNKFDALKDAVTHLQANK